MINVVDGRQQLDTMRWGMPGPVLLSKPRGRVTNVRNTASGHWQPWLAGPEVVVGKEKNRGGRCIVPASAFAEPDRNTAEPVINRWFGRADGLPFFFAGVWREWLGDRGTKAKPGLVALGLTTWPAHVAGQVVRRDRHRVRVRLELGICDAPTSHSQGPPAPPA